MSHKYSVITYMLLDNNIQMKSFPSIRGNEKWRLTWNAIFGGAALSKELWDWKDTEENAIFFLYS